MEGRGEPPPPLSPHHLHHSMAASQAPSFSAILQRQQQQQSQQHSQQHPAMHMPMPSPPGLHAPSAMRPSSAPAPSIGSPNNPSGGGGFHPDGSMALVPQQMSSPSMVGMIGGVRSGSEPVKRKRGRPRKYGDGATGSGGSSVSLALTPLSSINPASSPPGEKRRGRPPGSGKKQQLAALGSAGQGFTPHVITIAAGEDVATKIMSFSNTGPRAVCVLSANGAISNVTLRQPATSGGTVTYEGRFEILSLSGSFLLTESGGTRSRTGGLSVSLAGPDGRVVGGGVAGLLMAASPVQVVVGSFIADTRKAALPRTESGNPLQSPQAGVSPGMQRTPSTGKPDPLGSPRSPEDSPPNMEQQGSGSSNLMHSSQVQGLGSMHALGGWSSSQSLSERRDTDINIPLPGG